MQLLRLSTSVCAPVLHALFTAAAKVQITQNVIITIPQDIASEAGFGDRTAKVTAAAVCLKIIQFATGTNSPRLQLHFRSVWKKILSSCWDCFKALGVWIIPDAFHRTLDILNVTLAKELVLDERWLEHIEGFHLAEVLNVSQQRWQRHLIRIRETTTGSWIKLNASCDAL